MSTDNTTPEEHPAAPQNSQCTEPVPNDFGAGFHRCTRKAVEDGLCRQHYHKKNPPEFLARQHQSEPRVRTELRARSTLQWRTMDAPTIKPRYLTKPMFVTSLRITCYLGDTRVHLGASGFHQNKDGSAALTPTTASVSVDLFAESTQKLIDIEIIHLRGFLDNFEALANASDLAPNTKETLS